MVYSLYPEQQDDNLLEFLVQLTGEPLVRAIQFQYWSSMTLGAITIGISIVTLVVIWLILLLLESVFSEYISTHFGGAFLIVLILVYLPVLVITYHLPERFENRVINTVNYHIAYFGFKVGPELMSKLQPQEIS